MKLLYFAGHARHWLGGMIVAGVYAAWYSPDAKRAKVLQANAQRAKAAPHINTQEPA
ncbi:hypothetical protein [Xanthomonas vasicola]|uniref:hypothetical protein n=1 Tax=Xanthomonas vasicola TaxID=56459 RepID=UPI001646E4C0|nr:hypothetical protein [Xanthomonas vasicola]